mgnify:CR=1 FL=1
MKNIKGQDLVFPFHHRTIARRTVQRSDEKKLEVYTDLSNARRALIDI